MKRNFSITNHNVFFLIFFIFLSNLALLWLYLWDSSEMTVRKKGMTRTRGRCSEDKVSTHGTPALPTGLTGAPDSNYEILQSIKDPLQTCTDKHVWNYVCVWHVFLCKDKCSISTPTSSPSLKVAVPAISSVLSSPLSGLCVTTLKSRKCYSSSVSCNLPHSVGEPAWEREREKKRQNCDIMSILHVPTIARLSEGALPRGFSIIWTFSVPTGVKRKAKKEIQKCSNETCCSSLLGFFVV